MRRSSTPSETRRNAVLRARAAEAHARASAGTSAGAGAGAGARAVSVSRPAAVPRPVTTAATVRPDVSDFAGDKITPINVETNGWRRSASPSPNQRSRREPFVVMRKEEGVGGCGAFGVALIWVAIIFSLWAYLRLSPRFRSFRTDCAQSPFRSVVIGCICPGGHELEPLTAFTATLKLFGERCVPCRANTAKAGFNADVCVSCQSNEFSNAGAVSCKPCPGGTARAWNEATCRAQKQESPPSFSQRFLTGLSAGYQGLVRGLNERLWGSDAEFHREFEESGGLSNTAVWESLAPPSKNKCPFRDAYDVWEKMRTSDAFKSLSSAKCMKDVKKVFRRMSLDYHPDKFNQLYPECDDDLSKLAFQNLNNAYERAKTAARC